MVVDIFSHCNVVYKLVEANGCSTCAAYHDVELCITLPDCTEVVESSWVEYVPQPEFTITPEV